MVTFFEGLAVFQTPEEYRLISGGKGLGTMPIVNVMAPGVMLIFSRRRWIIQDFLTSVLDGLASAANGLISPFASGEVATTRSVEMVDVSEEAAILWIWIPAPNGGL